VSALLAVEGLRVRLPTPTGLVTVVDGVDYEVEPGQVFGVAGAARISGGSPGARSGWSSRIR